MKASELVDTRVRKMEIATANFENVMAQKVLTAAEHNEGVKEKHVGVLSGEEVRMDKERNDELEMLATETARSRTSVQDLPPQ